MQRWILLALVGFLSPLAVRAAEPRTITVSAQSELRVVPDEAVISFSISTEDKEELVIAKADNDAATAAVFKHVKSLGVTPQQFKVTNFSMGPRYAERRVFIGYGVTRSFELRTTKFQDVDPLIAGIVKAGGDRIAVDELHLQVRDQRQHQIETRRLAVEYARTKASHLAELNGMRLGHAIEILEDVEYNDDAGGAWGFGGFGGALGQAAEIGDAVAARSRALPDAVVHYVSLQTVAQNKKPDEAQQAETDLLLSPGQVSLNATVKITFELLPKE